MIPFTSHTFQGKSLIILKKLFWEAKYPVMACLQKNAMNFSKKDIVFKNNYHFSYNIRIYGMAILFTILFF